MSQALYIDEAVGGYYMEIMGVITASAALRTNPLLQEIGTNTKAVWMHQVGPQLRLFSNALRVTLTLKTLRTLPPPKDQLLASLFLKARSVLKSSKPTNNFFSL